MDAFIVAIGSVLALTLAGWLARSYARAPVCPICVGVSGTWAWMLLARLAGFAVEPAVLALLFGASTFAGAHWIEKRLPPGRSPMLWKACAIPAGLAASYGVATERWIAAGIGLAALGLLLALFLRPGPARGGDAAVVAQLEERMKRCC